jgi:hypothetical protein
MTIVLLEGDAELLHHVGETSRDARALLARFARTAVSAGLHPHSKWPNSRFSNVDDKVSYMWDLGSAFGMLYCDVKFRCRGMY